MGKQQEKVLSACRVVVIAKSCACLSPVPLERFSEKVSLALVCQGRPVPLEQAVLTSIPTMAALEALDFVPTVDKFTPLSEHQEQTPGTFFDGPPVLHLHAPNTHITLPLASHQKHQPLKSLAENASADAARESNVRIEDVDVWVTSK